MDTWGRTLFYGQYSDTSPCEGVDTWGRTISYFDNICFSGFVLLTVWASVDGHYFIFLTHLTQVCRRFGLVWTYDSREGDMSCRHGTGG